MGCSMQVSHSPSGRSMGYSGYLNNGGAGAAFGADGKPVTLPTYEELDDSLGKIGVLPKIAVFPQNFHTNPETPATVYEVAEDAFEMGLQDTGQLSLLPQMDDSAGTKTGSPPFSPHNDSAPQYQGDVGQSDDEMRSDVFSTFSPQDALLGMTDALSQVQDGVDQSDDEMSTITGFSTFSPEGDSGGMANDPYAPNIANLLDEEMGSADSPPFETQDDSEGMANDPYAPNIANLLDAEMGSAVSSFFSTQGYLADMTTFSPEVMGNVELPNFDNDWKELITKNAQHIQIVDHDHPNYRELAKIAIKKAPSALNCINRQLKGDLDFLIEIFHDQKESWTSQQKTTFKKYIPPKIQAKFEAQIRAQGIA